MPLPGVPSLTIYCKTENTSVNDVTVEKRVKLTDICLYTTWGSVQHKEQRHLVTCPASKRCVVYTKL